MGGWCLCVSVCVCVVVVGGGGGGSDKVCISFSTGHGWLENQVGHGG